VRHCLDVSPVVSSDQRQTSGPGLPVGALSLYYIGQVGTFLRLDRCAAKSYGCCAPLRFCPLRPPRVAGSSDRHPWAVPATDLAAGSAALRWAFEQSAKERRGRDTAAQSGAFIADLGKLDIEQDDEAPTGAFAQLLPRCRTHQLTSYDATYLDLAVRRRLPLATLDEPLRKAAKKLGFKLLGR